jgi:hypothetical protein
VAEAKLVRKENWLGKDKSRAPLFGPRGLRGRPSSAVRKPSATHRFLRRSFYLNCLIFEPSVEGGIPNLAAAPFFQGVGLWSW